MLTSLNESSTKGKEDKMKNISENVINEYGQNIAKQISEQLDEGEFCDAVQDKRYEGGRDWLLDCAVNDGDKGYYSIFVEISDNDGVIAEIWRGEDE